MRSRGFCTSGTVIHTRRKVGPTRWAGATGSITDVGMVDPQLKGLLCMYGYTCLLVSAGMPASSASLCNYLVDVYESMLIVIWAREGTACPHLFWGCDVRTYMLPVPFRIDSCGQLTPFHRLVVSNAWQVMTMNSHSLANRAFASCVTCMHQSRPRHNLHINVE